MRLRAKTKPVDTKAMEEEIGRLERERDQAVGAEDYAKANQLKTTLQEKQDALSGQKHPRQRAPEVTVEDIAEVVSRATGIPVSQLTQEERDGSSLEERLHERVVGQDEAVVAVAEPFAVAGPGSGTRSAPSGASCSSGRPASGRRSSRGRSPRSCSATTT